MVKVAVVILNWNGAHYLKEFLPSVVKNSDSNDVEVWVADNGSTDSSLSLIANEFKDVKVLKFDKNYGFTGGYNRALAEIKAEYFVLLNSDIEVTPNWIDPVIQVMDADSKIGAAMPKLLAYNNKQEFEYAGAAGGFIDLLGYPFCRGRLLSETESDTGQYDTPSDVFWATGACLFVKAELFNSMGGLDEDFFAHMEEIDFCWRIKNRGYRVVYVPNSKVYHVGGGTLPNNNPRKLFLNYRNNLYLLYKNLPKGRVVKVLFIRMILDGVSAIMYLLQRKFSFFLAVPKAHFAFYSSVGKYAKKRKENLKLRTVSNHPEMFKRSIVFSFFIRKVRKFSDLSPKGWS